MAAVAARRAQLCRFLESTWRTIDDADKVRHYAELAARFERRHHVLSGLAERLPS